MLLQFPHVVGCYVGRKVVRKKTRATLAVVCCVSKKQPTSRLATRALLPRVVPWLSTPRRTALVKTDVQTCGRSGRYAAVGPGDGLRAPETATLGFALAHLVLGPVVTTAGHAFIPNGFGQITFSPPRPVSLIELSSDPPLRISGRALRAVVSTDADYALLSPDGPLHNLFQDFFPIRGIQIPRPEHVGQPAFGLANSGTKQTKVVGIEGELPVGGVSMTGLILTDNIANPGDSGAALVDQHFCLMGVLVGFVTVGGRRLSAFATAQTLLSLERASLL